VGVLVFGPMLVWCRPAGAVPIPHRDHASADVPALEEWSRYLSRGPNFWLRVVHPPITQAIKSSIWESLKTDPGGTEAMVRYLLWKQSLDPLRFDHFHPRVASILTRIASARTPSAQLLPPPSIPVVSPSPPTVQSPVVLDENPSPPPVSEPGSLLVALGIAGWWVRRSRRRQVS
jgi:hypothetical protein